MSRRDFLKTASLGTLALASTPMLNFFCGSKKEASVRIGYLPITDATALLVAYDLGFFEEEGLRTQKPELIRGWAPLVEAFTAGKFNVVHLLKPLAIWLRYQNRFPAKVVAWAHTNGSAIVVSKKSKVREFADLGGKRIAVPFWYSMHNVVLQKSLRAAGLTPVIKAEGEPVGPREVNLQVLQPPEMPPALSAGKIDGYTVAEPFNALGELKADGKILRFTGDIWKNHPCCVVTMNERVIESNLEFTQKVVNALVRAQVYTSQNKEKVAVLLSKDGKGYLPVGQEVVLRAMTEYDEKNYTSPRAIRNKKEFQNSRINFQPWPYPSATKLLVEDLKKTLVAGDNSFLQNLDPNFVAEDLVDYRFVRQAVEKYPEWKKDPSVETKDPFVREEIFKL
ncbi:MAG: ABC transporter substrate-binding protein [Leptospiraceae bacterium]|nr:ABC transporter substrate-binding protein [Leptospiraceae bacterium]